MIQLLQGALHASHRHGVDIGQQKSSSVVMRVQIFEGRDIKS